MKDLTSGSMYKNFILFAIPLVLAALLSQAYSTIDTIIAGQFLGQDGLAAIGASASFLSFLSSAFWGFGAGFGIYVAKLFGAKEFAALKTDIRNNLLLMLGAMLLVSLLMLLLRTPIFLLLNIDPAIEEEAAHYYNIYVAGLSAILMTTNGVFIMNAMGNSSFPFLMSVLSAILNISGNLLSVTILHWGVSGIAFSTVFSCLVVDFAYLLKLQQCFAALGVKKVPMSFTWDCLRYSWRYSVPTCMQQIAMYFASLAMAPIVNGIGSAATAGYTVVVKIYEINSAIYQNSSKTLSNYAAQCVGGKKYDRLPRSLSVGLLQGILFTLPFLLACTLFSRPICALFFPSGFAGDALAYAVRFAAVFLPFIIINLLNNLFHAFFRGIAQMRLLLLSTGIGAVSRIIASILLSPLLGMDGIYLGWVISWVVEASFSLIVYFTRYRTVEQLRTRIEQQ